MGFAQAFLYESKACVLNHDTIPLLRAFQGRHGVQLIVKPRRQLDCMQATVLFTAVFLANCTAPSTDQLNDFMNLLASPGPIAIYLKVQISG